MIYFSAISPHVRCDITLEKRTVYPQKGLWCGSLGRPVSFAPLASQVSVTLLDRISWTTSRLCALRSLAAKSGVFYPTQILLEALHPSSKLSEVRITGFWACTLFRTLTTMVLRKINSACRTNMDSGQPRIGCVSYIKFAREHFCGFPS